jgi:hypothetical protein
LLNPIQAQVWYILIPQGPVEGVKTHKFTMSKLDKPLEYEYPDPSPTICGVVPRAAFTYFSDPAGTPSANKSYATGNLPLVSVHVTILTNATCIGLTLPHGVFDAKGAGEILHAIDAELNGKPWTPPPFSAKNVLLEMLKELQTSTMEESPMMVHTRREFGGTTFINMGGFVASLAWEYMWHGVETRAVVLGQDMVDKIVKKVKKQVLDESGGREWVSTGDILTAWFLKVC